MTDTTKQKLILQVLPAVAAANSGLKPATPEQRKHMWNEFLNEAESVAFLYEAKFLAATPPAEAAPKAE